MQLKTFAIMGLYLLGLWYVGAVLAEQSVVINEVLVHPSSSNKEWVELYVPNGMSVINDWIDDDTDFTNDSGGSTKKQITSAVQGADTQHVIFELPTSMFNNDGDTVALFSSDGQLLDQYQYSKDPGTDISIGRTPDAIGSFSVLANATRGSANSPSKPTATPTPEPTAKPAKEPKTTKTPETKSDTSSMQTLARDDTAMTSDGEIAAMGTDVSTTSSGTDSAEPTSILGVATKAAEKKKPKPTPEVMVKGSMASPLPLVLTSFGGLFLLSCGILIFLKKRGLWK